MSKKDEGQTEKEQTHAIQLKQEAKSRMKKGFCRCGEKIEFTYIGTGSTQVIPISGVVEHIVVKKEKEK